MSLSELQLPTLTHVVHAAADSTNASRLTPLERYDQIVTGTREVLDLAVRCGAQRFLLVSSGAVYGRQPHDLLRIPETYGGIADPLDVSSAYSVGKRAAEHLCRLYADRYGIEVVIARCFAFVGEDLPTDAHFAIGNFIRDALRSDAIVVRGSGQSVRSYLHQSDLVDWLLALLWHGKPDEAYNVGSDAEISIRELANLVRDIVSPHKPVQVLGSSQADTGPNRYIPEIDKIKRDLGVCVTFTLEKAIETTVDALIHPKDQS
jgi:dTDP-glucose 4,6-dehydratase